MTYRQNNRACLNEAGNNNVKLEFVHLTEKARKKFDSLCLDGVIESNFLHIQRKTLCG